MIKALYHLAKTHHQVTPVADAGLKMLQSLAKVW